MNFLYLMFKLINNDNNARIGKLNTKHGVVETPCFMPVATKGAVKLVNTTELKDMGVGSLISNAYILSLRPGLDVIEGHKGLHKFMNWDKTIFTDCGGFQVLSLDGFFQKITSKGILFKSPFDGKKDVVTPKKIMNIHKKIGSDVAMALDHMPLYGCSKSEAITSLKNTHKWMEECKKIQNDEQLLFGIAQGSVYPELRKKSTQFIDSLDFDGIAYGGLAVGESKDEMYNMIKISTENCSFDKPHYLMGVGNPASLLDCIELGVDIFDSVFPTRNARHGQIFTKKGAINILNSKFKEDYSSLDECKCDVCRKHTKSYFHHLFKTKEPLGLRLASYHNLFFIQNLIKDAKKAIKGSFFSEFKTDFLGNYLV